MLMLACAMLAPTTALALTTNKATARPNEDGGSGVIGGLDTRLTWEGTVEEGEEVSAVTLMLPDDGTFDDSSTKITVLEGLSRAAVEGQAVASGSKLEVTFSEPITEG
jgi:polar amino acid transport system substrate-binding protein